MGKTLNDTGPERGKENLKEWMKSYPQEYGEMAMGMGEDDLLETFIMGQAAFLASPEFQKRLEYMVDTDTVNIDELVEILRQSGFAEKVLTNPGCDEDWENYQTNIKSVSAVKQRGGIMAIRIMMKDGMSMMIPMDDPDESRYRRLFSNDIQDFLNNLAVHYLTREDVRSIIQRIRQTTKNQTAVRVLPQPKDFTSQMAKSFSLNLASSLSFLKVDTSRGENREWEVGNRSGYDDLDTKLTDSIFSL